MNQPRQITHSTPPDWVGVEVSSACPFNCDGTRLLLVRRDHFGLYDGSGAFIKDLPIAASQEPRWSRTNPNFLYFISGNAINTYSFTTDIRGVLAVFTEYVSISGKGESDISAVDHFALAGTKANGSVEVFVYSLKDGKDSVYPQKLPFDGLKLTASNQIVLSRGTNKGTDGIFVLRNGSEVRLTFANGHAAVATYNGMEVLLFCNSNENPIRLPDFPNAVVMVDVDTGRQIGLKSFDWRYAFHVSAADGFCIVSTDCPDRSLPGQIWKAPYDGSPATLICDTGSLYTGYNSQAKAAVSRDGSKVVFCSNGGKTDDPNTCDVFMVGLDVVSPVPQPMSTAVSTGLRPVKFPPNKHYEIHIDTDDAGNPAITEYEN